MQEHPLLSHNPEEWNNIPICLIDAVKGLIASEVKGGESLYDFQMTQNARAYKLQT